MSISGIQYKKLGGDPYLPSGSRVTFPMKTTVIMHPIYGCLFFALFYGLQGIKNNGTSQYRESRYKNLWR